MVRRAWIDFVLTKPTQPLPMAEFVTVMALMTSLVALSIDAMLPALGAIGSDLNTASDNDRQLVIGMLFFGMAVGQLVFGPVSDSTGRKPVIFFGVSVFVVGCVISAFSETFFAMLVGRFLQEIGAAAPRKKLRKMR